MDKLTEYYAIRIPEKTKRMIDALPAEWQKKLRNEIRLTMAKVLHEYRMWSQFKPEEYFQDEFDMNKTKFNEFMAELFGEEE